MMTMLTRVEQHLQPVFNIALQILMVAIVRVNLGSNLTLVKNK